MSIIQRRDIFSQNWLASYDLGCPMWKGRHLFCNPSCFCTDHSNHIFCRHVNIYTYCLYIPCNTSIYCLYSLYSVLCLIGVWFEDTNFLQGATKGMINVPLYFWSWPSTCQVILSCHLKMFFKFSFALYIYPPLHWLTTSKTLVDGGNLQSCFFSAVAPFTLLSISFFYILTFYLNRQVITYDHFDFEKFNLLLIY